MARILGTSIIPQKTLFVCYNRIESIQKNYS